MKKVMLLLAGFLAFGSAVHAQEDSEDSRFLNELKITGEIDIRSQLNTNGSGHYGIDKAEIGFNYRFTEYTGVTYIMRMGTGLEGGFGGAYGPGPKTSYDNKFNVGTEKFYGYTDFLAEAGVDQIMGLGFKVGKFDDASEYRVKHHALDFGFETGDGLRQDKVHEPLNIRWDMPINAMNDIMPLRIWVIHDADFSRSNNDVSVSAHLESHGFNFANADILLIDWNMYYNYQGAANRRDRIGLVNNPNYGTPDAGNPGFDTNGNPEFIDGTLPGGISVARHTVGGSMGTTLILDTMRIGFGFTLDYGRHTAAREYSGNAMDKDGMTVRDGLRMFSDQNRSYMSHLNYGVGVRFAMDDIFRVNLGYYGQVKMDGYDHSSNQEIGNYLERHVFAARFDLLLVPMIEIYAGMSVDLRGEEAMKAHFGKAADGKLGGHERFGVDVGVTYTGIDHVRIYLGYFWGNMHNGGIEAPRFGGNMESFNTISGNGRRNQLGSAFYLKSKFYI